MDQQSRKDREYWFSSPRKSVENNEDWFQDSPSGRKNWFLFAFFLLDEIIIVGLIIYGIYWLITRFLL